MKDYSRIYHVALVAEWERARKVGAYTTSSLGVTLAEEGFIHTSRIDQWEGVLERYYGDVTDPLVLLVIDPALLTSPMVIDPVPSLSDEFPHVYGPINPDAVVETRPLER